MLIVLSVTISSTLLCQTEKYRVIPGEVEVYLDDFIMAQHDPRIMLCLIDPKVLIYFEQILGQFERNLL